MNGRCHRLRAWAFALLPALLVWASTQPSPAQESRSLLGSLAPWSYPGATMRKAQASDGATVNAAGDRTVPSVRLQALLTTKDPVPKVVEFYRAMLAAPAKPTGDATKDKTAAEAGRSVAFQDDSPGRPIELQTILVNTQKTSTTLVISRGAGETETRIRWMQYSTQ